MLFWFGIWFDFAVIQSKYREKIVWISLALLFICKFCFESTHAFLYVAAFFMCIFLRFNIYWYFHKIYYWTTVDVRSIQLRAIAFFHTITNKEYKKSNFLIICRIKCVISIVYYCIPPFKKVFSIFLGIPRNWHNMNEKYLQKSRIFFHVFRVYQMFSIILHNVAYTIRVDSFFTHTKSPFALENWQTCWEFCEKYFLEILSFSKVFNLR